MSKQLYNVEITRSVVTYFDNIEANSPEEAEDIATRYLEDGEDGVTDLAGAETTCVDVYPSDDEEGDD